MLFFSKGKPYDYSLLSTANCSSLQFCNNLKFLDLNLDLALSCYDHINNLEKKLSSKNVVMVQEREKIHLLFFNMDELVLF